MGPGRAAKTVRGSGPELRDCGRALLFCGREPGVTWGCDKNFVRTGTGGRNGPDRGMVPGLRQNRFMVRDTGGRRNFFSLRKRGRDEIFGYHENRGAPKLFRPVTSAALCYVNAQRLYL